MVESVVCGYGVVGKATALTFGIKDYFDLKGSNISLKEIAERKRFVFICIPTPTKDGQQQGREEIAQLIHEILDQGGGQKVFIIRSTILPGTVKYLIGKCMTDAIIHNPEFLTQATWEKDAKYPDVVVLGGENPNYLENVEGLYKARFKGSVDIIRTDSITSEMIKYGVNTFYAMKIVFANELWQICQDTGANYEKVKEVMYKRRWIGKNHLRIYDEKGKRGAGGGCLGKDLEAFSSSFPSKLLKLVDQLNKEVLQK